MLAALRAAAAGIAMSPAPLKVRSAVASGNGKLLVGPDSWRAASAVQYKPYNWNLSALSHGATQFPKDFAFAGLLSGKLTTTRLAANASPSKLQHVSNFYS